MCHPDTVSPAFFKFLIFNNLLFPLISEFQTAPALRGAVQIVNSFAFITTPDCDAASTRRSVVRAKGYLAESVSWAIVINLALLVWKGLREKAKCVLLLQNKNTEPSLLGLPVLPYRRNG